MLAAVCMAKDEADTIGGWIRHFAEQGAQVCAILNNGSTDGTYDAAAEAARDVRDSCSVLILDDPEVGYYQSRKISAVCDRLGRDLGVDWIVPADADELWHVADGTPLDQFFAEQSRFVVREAELLTHYCTATDDDLELDPFVRLRWRHPDVAPLPKVAFRWKRGAVVHQGNHGVDVAGPRSSESDGLTVRHFPYRSIEQFVRKVRNGAAAYAATTGLPEGMGNHWRSYGEILEHQGEQGLASVFMRHFYFPSPVDAGLLEEPAPYRP